MMQKVARVQFFINIIVICSIIFRVLQVGNLSKLFGLADLGGFIWIRVSHTMGLLAFVLDNLLCYFIIIEFIFNPLLDAKRSLGFRYSSSKPNENTPIKVDVNPERSTVNIENH